MGSIHRVVDGYLQEFVELPGAPNGRGVPYRLGLHVYPDPGPTAPAVVIWPALGVPARFYRPFAQALGAAGVAVMVAELRGTGTSTPRPTRADSYGYTEMVGDVGTVLDALKSRIDARPYYLLGHSLGGQLATLHLALNQAGAAGLILVAVGLPHFRSYTSWPWLRRMAVLGLTQATAAVATVNRVSPGWAFAGRASRRLILDWAYTARHGIFPPIDGTRVGLSRLRTPVLAISTPLDRLTPAETLDRICAMLPSAPIERVHLAAPHDHFSWVRSPDAVAEHVVRFVAGSKR